MNDNRKGQDSKMAYEHETATSDPQEKSKTAQLIETAQARLAGMTGKRYWQTVDELAETPDFEDALRREFPQHASEWVDSVSRRGFMKLMLSLIHISEPTRQ